MGNGFEFTAAPQNCWNEIGVWGNGTCPELARVTHCRDCGVYVSGGRRLLDRPAAADYIESWTATLAQERVATGASTASHLVFRIGTTWFALPAAGLREITEPTTVRSVPHRARDLLRGLVNVRGELYPCVSLHTLFGEEETVPAPRAARFLVAYGAGDDWVFQADEVHGMHDVAEADKQPLPITLLKVDVVYAENLFPLGDKSVAILNEDLLFGTLVRRIA